MMRGKKIPIYFRKPGTLPGFYDGVAVLPQSGSRVAAKVSSGRDAGTVRCRWSCESAVWLMRLANV